MSRRDGGRVALPFYNLGARWGWMINATPRPLYALERDQVPTVQEAEWTIGSVRGLSQK